MTESYRPNSAYTNGLRHELVDDLVDGGALRTPRLRGAFAAVPRHAFLPRFFRPLAQVGQYAVVDGTEPGQFHEWLRLAYSNETWVTQLDGDDSPESGTTSDQMVKGTPTASSTMPALMATMLESLDIDDGNRVLEIGTGTGYNAALLCEGLGSCRVTTIDIDRALVDHAQSRLRDLGYFPTVAVADASYGHPSNAPYDRILATCSMPHIPRAWLHQTNLGGVLLTSLHRGLGGGPLVRLTMTGSDTAQGHFLSEYASFMPTRLHAAPDALDLLRRVDTSNGATRETSLVGEEFDDLDFAFIAALLCPTDAVRIDVAADHGGWEHWLLTPDGSWAYQTSTSEGRLIATQGGPARLWDQLEYVHGTWNRLDRPTRDRFGLTATPEEQYLWLDHADSGQTWPLATRSTP